MAHMATVCVLVCLCWSVYEGW